MSKTVLITGGGGFLGFNLLNYFIKKNYAVHYIIIENFITSNTKNLYNFISKNDLKTKVELVNGDLCDVNVMEYIKLHYKAVHEIYHLASLASPPFYKKYPIETLDVGYIGMKNILELCKHYTQTDQKCRLMYTSTSEVYGDALEHPQKESYYGNVNSYGERSCYDVSKRIGETLIYSYKSLYNLDTRIVRIFNTYGPYMRLGDGRIVTEIIRCILLGKTLQIFGDGSQTRSLSYVDDTIEMMLNVMHSDYSSPVNVGNEREISINELVSIAKNVYEKKLNNNKACNLQVQYTDIDKDDPKVRRPDLTTYKSCISKVTPTELEVGLYKTMMYFKDYIDFSEM
jgi:nucleoside-diphosphate-sugar epimerase